MKLLGLALLLTIIGVASEDAKVIKIVKTIERVDSNSTGTTVPQVINIHLKNSNKCKIVIN